MLSPSITVVIMERKMDIVARWTRLISEGMKNGEQISLRYHAHMSMSPLIMKR